MRLSEMLDRSREGDTLLLSTQTTAMMIAYCALDPSLAQPYQSAPISKESSALDDYGIPGGNVATLVRRLAVLDMVSRDLLSSEDDEDVKLDDEEAREFLPDDPAFIEVAPEPNPGIPDNINDLFVNIPTDILLEDDAFEELIKDLSESFETDAFRHDRAPLLYNRAALALEIKDYPLVKRLARKALDLMGPMPDMSGWVIEAKVVLAEALACQGSFSQSDLMLSEAYHSFEQSFAGMRLPNIEQRLSRTKKLIERLKKKASK